MTTRSETRWQARRRDRGDIDIERRVIVGDRLQILRIAAVSMSLMPAMLSRLNSPTLTFVYVWLLSSDSSREEIAVKVEEQRLARAG